MKNGISRLHELAGSKVDLCQVPSRGASGRNSVDHDARPFAHRDLPFLSGMARSYGVTVTGVYCGKYVICHHPLGARGAVVEGDVVDQASEEGGGGLLISAADVETFFSTDRFSALILAGELHLLVNANSSTPVYGVVGQRGPNR